MTAQATLPWGDDLAVPPEPARLRAWQPENWDVASDWQADVSAFLASDAGQHLARRVQERLDQGVVVFPPQPLTALALTARQQVRVLILGQDPYHGPGQAEGLAFSVAHGQKCPPSLRNIFKELDRGAAARGEGLAPRQRSVSLRAWAAQGVLLLNTCLTVEQGRPLSHVGLGWEEFTGALVRRLAGGPKPVVFMLWGAHAQKFAPLVGQLGQGRHLVLCANHPSPLSASRGPTPFLGCGHFDQANAFLARHGHPAIDW